MSRSLVGHLWPWVLLATACAPEPGRRTPASAPTAAPAAASPTVFLWSLPVTASEAARALAPRGEDEVGRSLSVSFEAAGASNQELLRRFPTLSTGAPSGSGARITIAPLVERAQPVAGERREATFVIDYDQKAVQDLLATIPTEARTPEDLEAFVGRTLAETHSRGFDIASRVATLKRGDCTEHAVLLAALLRASGHSARVIVGVVILMNPELALAAGHAWVEVAEQGVWRRLDAALHRDQAGNWTGQEGLATSTLRQTVRLYLATRVLESEGPNFARELLEYASKLAPKGLTLDRLAGP